MKIILGLLVLLFGLIIGILVLQNYAKTKTFIFTTSPVPTKTETATATETINNHTFNIEVAKTAIQKEIGLSEKRSLPQDSGMLFPFDKPDYYPFWMKNMKFPIDIIYIKDNTIVGIFQNAQPQTGPDQNLTIYKPISPADSVLEINAGLSSKYNFKEGDKVTAQNIK